MNFMKRTEIGPEKYKLAFIAEWLISTLKCTRICEQNKLI